MSTLGAGAPRRRRRPLDLGLRQPGAAARLGDRRLRRWASSSGLLHGDTAIAAIERAQRLAEVGRRLDRGARRLVRAGGEDPLPPRRAGARAQPVARACVLESPVARRATAHRRGSRTAPRSGRSRRAAQPAGRRAYRRSRRGRQARRSREPARRRQDSDASARSGFSRIAAMRRRRRRARSSPRSAPGSGRGRVGAAPDRLVVVVDNLDALPAEAAVDWIDAAQSAIGPGSVGILAFDPGRLAARSAASARRAGASANGCRSWSTCRPAAAPTASSWSRGCCRRRAQPAPAPDPAIATALVEPLSSAETALLAALAPLAAHSPRDAKRFLNAYRLARCSKSPRPVVALMQAVGLRRRRRAGGDARAARQRLGRTRRHRRSAARWSRPSGPRAPPTTARYRSRTRAPRRRSPAATPCRSKCGAGPAGVTRLPRASHRRGAGAQVVAAPQALSHLPKLSR